MVSDPGWLRFRTHEILEIVILDRPPEADRSRIQLHRFPMSVCNRLENDKQRHAFVPHNFRSIALARLIRVPTVPMGIASCALISL